MPMGYLGKDTDAWDNFSDPQKENLITNSLKQAFEAGKNSSLSKGLSVRDYWWRMISGSTNDDYASFLNNNEWIKLRITGKEAEYKFDFDYVPKPRPVIDPLKYDPGTDQSDLPADTALNPAPSDQAGLGWPVIIGMVSIGLAAVYYFYQKNK